ncbi:MAG: SUMF1/EgtB/PvdO family nonheme iron enzyme, partial [Rhodospirillaceae bacterium]|nr:SUMF1/EgtB/PvdO family nonheme iron enzyme [Rhodospirillaceae bacterium]
MSLQAVRIEDAQVFSSTREYLLPLTPGVVAKKGTDATARKKGFVSIANTSSRIVTGKTSSFSARDCGECPEMVVVPSGGFMMGSPESEERRSGNEGPVRRVFVPKPFAVSKYEVTFDEWDAC